MMDLVRFTRPLQDLLVCRPLLKDDLFRRLIDIAASPDDEAAQYAFAAAMIERAEQLGLSGNLLHGYTAYKLMQGENIAAVTAEKNNGRLGASLEAALVHDMEILCNLLAIPPSRFAPQTPFLDDYRPTAASAVAALATLQQTLARTLKDGGVRLAALLIEYYRTYGYGDMAHFRAFRWTAGNQLAGIAHFDEIQLEDIVGYERQKETLLANTNAFIAGKPANHVLLIGSRGAGKSSSVKALVNRLFPRGLRLVEIKKSQLAHLSQVMERLRGHSSKKFIIFLDDLSFEDFEVEYKYLKSTIEGGVEAKPANVLIYATSNRRHLIKENWEERGRQEELHHQDSVNEKISLSDRFGVTITYLAPNQEEYLAIVEHLARKHQIGRPAAELRRDALRWEMAHSGRSGRTAQQFINHLLGAG